MDKIKMAKRMTWQHWRWQIAQFAERKWWRRYLRKKEVSDYLNWKKKYWQNLMEKLELAVPSHERVLDMGCGPAGIFMVLPTNKVVAVDPLLESYARDLPQFDPSWYRHVTFETSTLESWESDNPFPWVFCLNAINHVRDMKLGMAKLAELTAPGGTLILSIDAHNIQVLKYVFRWLPGDILHPHQYGLGGYKALLEENGFSVQTTHLSQKRSIFNYYVLICQKK